jgi:hypothetical protein
MDVNNSNIFPTSFDDFRHQTLLMRDNTILDDQDGVVHKNFWIQFKSLSLFKGK